MRVAVDTNILVYAEGLNGGPKEKRAEEVVLKLPVDETFLPVQVLGELYRVMVRKAGRPPKTAKASLVQWQASFPVIETSHSILVAAVDLSAEHGLDIWDAVILAAAASVGCHLLFSEDLQDGFIWRGVEVVNPFAAKHHSLLERLSGS